MGQINCGVFDVFPVELLAQILSVCHDFTLINQTFKTFKMNINWSLGYEFVLQWIKDLAIMRP